MIAHLCLPPSSNLSVEFSPPQSIPDLVASENSWLYDDARGLICKTDVFPHWTYIRSDTDRKNAIWSIFRLIRADLGYFHHWSSWGMRPLETRPGVSSCDLAVVE